MLSSEIEGTEATLVDVLAWEQADQLGASSIEDIEEVTNTVAAVNHAFKEIHSPTYLANSSATFTPRTIWRRCCVSRWCMSSSRPSTPISTATAAWVVC